MSSYQILLLLIGSISAQSITTKACSEYAECSDGNAYCLPDGTNGSSGSCQCNPAMNFFEESVASYDLGGTTLDTSCVFKSGKLTGNQKIIQISFSYTLLRKVVEVQHFTLVQFKLKYRYSRVLLVLGGL